MHFSYMFINLCVQSWFFNWGWFDRIKKCATRRLNDVICKYF